MVLGGGVYTRRETEKKAHLPRYDKFVIHFLRFLYQIGLSSSSSSPPLFDQKSNKRHYIDIYMVSIVVSWICCFNSFETLWSKLKRRAPTSCSEILSLKTANEMPSDIEQESSKSGSVSGTSKKARYHIYIFMYRTKIGLSLIIRKQFSRPSYYEKLVTSSVA